MLTPACDVALHPHPEMCCQSSPCIVCSAMRAYVHTGALHRARRDAVLQGVSSAVNGHPPMNLAGRNRTLKAHLRLEVGVNNC